MTDLQIPLDLGGRPTVRFVLDRIRTESRDESEKGCWFEQLFMHLARQEPEFEIDAIWRWPDWPERESLTGLDGRDIGIDLVSRRLKPEVLVDWRRRLAAEPTITNKRAPDAAVQHGRDS